MMCGKSDLELEVLLGGRPGPVSLIDTRRSADLPAFAGHSHGLQHNRVSRITCKKGREINRGGTGFQE